MGRTAASSPGFGGAFIRSCAEHHEQRATLELAAGYGYYETSCEPSLQEIADAEDVPTSTLQYRLRRAEAWLAKTVLADGRGIPRRRPVSADDWCRSRWQIPTEPTPGIVE